MGFRLEIGFNELFQLITIGNNNSSWIDSVYNLLWYALNVLNLLRLHQYLPIMASNGRCSLSSKFPVPVPQP